MAKALVTADNVAQTADELVAQGQEPTILTVQEAIGGGSYSTVKRYLDAWKAARTTAEAVGDLPPEVAQVAQAAMQRVWQVAVAHAEQRVVQVREEMQRQVAEVHPCFPLTSVLDTGCGGVDDAHYSHPLRECPRLEDNSSN